MGGLFLFLMKGLLVAAFAVCLWFLVFPLRLFLMLVGDVVSGWLIAKEFVNRLSDKAMQIEL